MTTVNEKIRQIIADECFLDPALITPTALFANLGVDSLAQIQIWMRIGQEFEIEIPEPDSTFWAGHPVQKLDDVLGIVSEMKQLPAPVSSALAARAGH